MKTEEYPIVNNRFDYNGKTYDCKFAIRRDKELILQEAEISHKDSFDDSYDRETLNPQNVRVFVDNKGNPIFGMILYTIRNKVWNYNRVACGDYYQIHKDRLIPHPYQASICW